MVDEQSSTPLQLQAPVTGIYSPLDEISDEAFSSGALGPGFFVEPLEPVISAPCAGRIIAIASTHHAITLETECGAEILLHVGIDTVKLGGDGFQVEVADNQWVEPGTALIRFEPGTLMTKAKSLATPIILLTPDTHSLQHPPAFGWHEKGTAITSLSRLKHSSGGDVPTDSDTERSETSLPLPLAQGLHARPAAQIAKLAKTFAGTVELAFESRRANGKSMAGLMSLGLTHGSVVTIMAAGDGAETIVHAIAQLIESGAGDPVKPVQVSTGKIQEAPLRAPVLRPGDTLHGVMASPGLCVGPVFHHRSVEIAVPDHDESPELALDLFANARSKVAEELRNESRQAKGAVAGILDAHAELIEDPDLVDVTEEKIHLGISAGSALKAVIAAQISRFQASGDARLQARSADLRDIEKRLLNAMYGGEQTSADIPKGAIIIADDLMPSEFLSYVDQGLSGLCLAAGGQTSHVAILATGENIPTLVATGPSILDIPAGVTAILNASSSQITYDPGEQEISRAQDKIEQRKQAMSTAQLARHDPASTLDNVHIAIYANLGSLEDASKAVLNGAEGSGLLRTEFLFTDRETAPSEDEQVEAYLAILNCMKRKPVTIRTLDIGGDKPVPFLDHGEEPNPALGMRGIRTLQIHPHLMRDHVNAILRASERGNVQIMVPMIASVSELQDFRDYVCAQAKELGLGQVPAIGTMIETPASAVIADQLASVADFLSIGTNDLTQYTLAMDRGHPQLAARIDGLHPAVLRLIKNVVEATSAKDIPVSLCGGLASDPFAVPLLLGLGIRKLSCAQAMIAPIKALIRELELAQCRQVALAAQQLNSASDIRHLVSESWPALERWT